MTSQGVKFYKFNSSTTSATKIATAKATEGAIIYIVDARELWIGGATAAQAQLVIKGANDVTFSNNVLTLTHYDNGGTATTQTLDFSDVASASSTMAVFEAIYTKMGLTGQNHDTIDYTNTHYLSDLGEQDQPAKNLVNADKALDAAIYGGTTMAADSTAVYDTEHLSNTWTTVVEANEIEAGDAVTADVEKLDKKVAQLANEVIANEQVTQEAFTAVANSVGLESDMSLDLSAQTYPDLPIIQGDTSVKEALLDLADYVTTEAGKVDDVRINNTTIVPNKIANIAVDGTYDATDNKIATKSTVENAIDGLDVTEYAQATIDTITTSGETAFKVKGIKEVDGKIEAGTNTVDLKIDGTYNASTNMIATESTVSSAIGAIAGAGLAVDNAGVITATTQSAGDNTTNVATTAFVKNAIDALDTQSDVQAVDYTAATSSTGAKLTFKGVSETDGIIAQGAGNTELQFAKVATTGAASDVSYTNSTSGMTAQNVQAAIDELDGRVDSLVGGMRYNGDILTASATVNTSTGDVRPGDIYLASGAFTIGTTSVEAGDMIVYKGTTSQSDVALDNTNCTIIERETDTMVTAGGTLADDYIVFGNGNKDVTTTSTVNSADYTVSASDLKTAIENANSALQSISHGTDGTYVTTTVGTKANNDQSVGVAVQQATVTYTAASDPNPATLTATNGLLDESAITPIKNYVDAKVGTAVQSVDGSATEQGKSVTQSDYATVKVTATTDANNNVTLDSAVGLTVQAVSTADASHMGLAEASDVKTYVDGKITALDGSATIASKSGNVVTIKTGVTETDGIINNDSGTDIVLDDVAVTGAAADVSYDNTNSHMTATTVQAAIDELKSGLCWEEYE